MNLKDCRVTRREIDESDLNQRLSERAQAHVASCASCQGFRAERTSLRELVGSLEPVTAPGDFDLRLRARLAQEKQANSRAPFFFRLVIGTPAIAAAALVVMLALALAWFAQRNVTRTPEIAKAPITEMPLAPETSTGAVKPVNNTVAADNKELARSGNTFRAKGSRMAQAVTAQDYGTSPAQSFQQVEQRDGEVSLSAPVKPMVVSMQDDRGETRRITLPPVSFGAQRMVGNRIPVSTTNSRSW